MSIETPPMERVRIEDVQSVTATSDVPAVTLILNVKQFEEPIEVLFTYPENVATLIGILMHDYFAQFGGIETEDIAQWNTAVNIFVSCVAREIRKAPATPILFDDERRMHDVFSGLRDEITMVVPKAETVEEAEEHVEEAEDELYGN